MDKYSSPPAPQPGARPPAQVRLGQQLPVKPREGALPQDWLKTRMKGSHFLSASSRNSFRLLNKQKLPRTEGGNTSHPCQNKNKDDSQMLASQVKKNYPSGKVLYRLATEKALIQIHSTCAGSCPFSFYHLSPSHALAQLGRRALPGASTPSLREPEKG